MTTGNLFFVCVQKNLVLCENYFSLRQFTEIEVQELLFGNDVTVLLMILQISNMQSGYPKCRKNVFLVCLFELGCMHAMRVCACSCRSLGLIKQ